jgi:glycosyltransferase involved in cell wall biosynthesis
MMSTSKDKILIIAADKGGKFTPFVEEQAASLMAKGANVIRYPHNAHGMLNYLKEIWCMRKTIIQEHPDVIHAHFGLTGLAATVAVIGLRIPVVITYHGCDINDTKIRPFSQLAMRLADWSIFVSHRQMINAYGSECRAQKYNNWCILPCGVNVDTFCHSKINEQWFEQNFQPKKYVLFAGSFESAVKNSSLAKQAIEVYNCNHPDAPLELLELRGYTRDEVVTLMYKCDTLLLTSIREGSPQVIKEAMACGCPIVSVDVGDVGERLTGLDGCYVATSRTPEDLANLLEQSVSFGRTKGREQLLDAGLDNAQIAEKLMSIYTKIIQ